MRISDWSSDVCSSDLLYLAAQRERTLDIHERGERVRLPPRHQLLSEQVADPFDPEAPGIDVDFLAYQLHIVTSLDENAEMLLQNSENCKFAEIVQTAPGKYKMAVDYVLPTVTTAASRHLLDQKSTRLQ